MGRDIYAVTRARHVTRPCHDILMTFTPTCHLHIGCSDNFLIRLLNLWVLRALLSCGYLRSEIGLDGLACWILLASRPGLSTLNSPLCWSSHLTTESVEFWSSCLISAATATPVPEGENVYQQGNWIFKRCQLSAEQCTGKLMTQSVRHSCN